MDTPLVVWFRRDLRLDDNPMLFAAAASGRPVLPVFIADPLVMRIGAAPRWRWGLAVEAFSRRLAGLQQRLILRSGDAAEVLTTLARETGAREVWWSRLYDKDARARDLKVETALQKHGLKIKTFPGHVLAEPWEVMTQAGDYFRVYTPFWRALSAREWPSPTPAPKALRPPAQWPASERLEDWRLEVGMKRGAAVVRPFLAVGEDAALSRLNAFFAGPARQYHALRDRLDLNATSGLSENLTYGEIGVRRIWAVIQAELAARPGDRGVEAFAREIVWREFAHHLAFHSPHIVTENWRAEWNQFPWRPDNADAEAWRRGLTGEPLVDAGIRELWVTGRMHNRARMVTASYLTKHLLTHWKVGADFFAEMLVDWDPASNAMGWQWVAGSGPDAAPYFRIFNPALQAEKFDPAGTYRRAFLAEGQASPPRTALAFFEAVPRSWQLDPTKPYPRPLVDLAAARERALAAWQAGPGATASHTAAKNSRAFETKACKPA